MSNQNLTLGMAGKRVRARMAALYPSLRDGKATIEATPVEVPGPLDEVMFASVAARTLAESAELMWADFSHSSQGASSERGYTAADVRAVIEERDDSPD